MFYLKWDTQKVRAYPNKQSKARVYNKYWAASGITEPQIFGINAFYMLEFTSDKDSALIQYLKNNFECN